MAAEGASELGWEVAVRLLQSASYVAFDLKELAPLLCSVIERTPFVDPVSGRMIPSGERACFASSFLILLFLR
ncbi:hypothetical protein NDU88_006359 [Pleurodeles waltl]|uniref:Uncharacterized protein n=1 Tax=Pleurodeles waltl TaxID=8319 RepID=A0AAV7QNC4_PLEWA|nr:hypothetical protein NDU88_006359 [Pleurodeles waltl]